MNIGTLTVTLMADMTQLDKMTTGLNSISQRFRTFGYLASTALTLPMVMAGKASFQMAKDFEFSMQKIVGLTGVAQSAVNKWSDEILKMGPQLGKTPQELADALYFISSSGIKGAEAMNVLALSAKAAEAGLGETKDVANVLTSALNAYRGTGLTAAYATDVLIAAIREGKAEAPGFVSAMGQLIPIAANMGVSFDQVAGGMAAITLTGSSAASAAVYLKGVFNTLLTANKQGVTALKSVGLSYEYLRKVLADGPNGLINVMQIFRDVQMTLGDEAIKDVLPNIRALTGYMSLAGKNFEYNTGVMKRVTEATGSLGVAWAAVSNTIKVRFDQAISQANVSLITLGKSVAASFLPLLEKLVKKLGELVKWFNSLSDAQKENKLKWLAFIAILGPASLLISVVGYALSGLISIIRGVIVVFNLLRLAIITNPVGLLITGVLALGVALMALALRTKDATDKQTALNKVWEEAATIRNNSNFGSKSVDERMSLISKLDTQQLETLKNDINTRIQLEKDLNIKLLTTKKEGLKDDKYILDQKKIIADAELKMFDLRKNPSSARNSWDIGQNQNQINIANQALRDYKAELKDNLDYQITSIPRIIKLYETYGRTVSAEIEKITDPILKQIALAEKLKIYNDKIAEITGGVSDELKYTDSLATVMKTLGIEYDAVGAKADIFLKVIQDLTKEGLPANSREIQKVIEQYQKLRQEITASPITKALTDNLVIPNLGDILAPGPKYSPKTGTYQKHTVEELTNGLVRQAEVVNMLSNSFSELFSDLNIGFKSANSGFQRMINGMLQSIARLLTELLAKAALWAILNVITGGGAGAFKVFMGFAKAPAPLIPGMANGGSIPPGFPNDSYLARLTSGETVLPTSMNGAAAQRNGMSGEVVFTIAGTTLVGVLKNQNRKTNSYS
jgi:TP901 family phage tail tape measure protein